MKSPKKIAIIGAGPAGLTAAYELSKDGYDCEVFEASSQVGGLSKSIELWGQIVDMGPHRFFSMDPRVNSFWHEIVGPDQTIVQRLTRIFYQGRFFSYPLELSNVLLRLGIFESFRCLSDFIKERIFPTRFKNEDSFESWVIRRFGRRLYEIFFKTYSEKLWGISCQKLHADFAKQRIKKLSFWEALKSSVFIANRTAHKTLADQFYYPNAGAGSLYLRMAQKIKASGGTVHLEEPVLGVYQEESRIQGIILKNGEKKPFDFVISTMPLPDMVRQLNLCPPEVLSAADSLRFRNTILVYLEIDSSDIFPDQWIYVHSNLLKTGRITNFRNWVPGITKGKSSTILSFEFWCFEQDSLWRTSTPELVALAKEELDTLFPQKKLNVLNGHIIKLSKSYPVYEMGYQAKIEVIKKYLQKFSNLYVIGRYGSFKYNNQDHSILMGLIAADRISNRSQVDLWGINSDYETYQESGAN